MGGASLRAASKMMHSSIVAGVLIVATSCSGGDDAMPAFSANESPESAESTSDSPFAIYLEGPIPDAAAVIHREHGDVDGFAVTVVALDSGYSVSQIVANPSIGADGLIVGLDPDGAPLGLVESDAGPQGFRATPSTTPPPPKRPTDRLLFLFDLTLDDVHEEATKQLQAQLDRDFEEWKAAAQAELAAAESEAEDIRLAAVVLILIAQGYTLDDAMQGIFFGDYEVSGGAACARLSTPPTGPKLTGAAFDCELGFPDTSTTQAADEQTQPAPEPADNTNAGPEFEEATYAGVYQASIVDAHDFNGSPPSSIVTNLFTFDFTGEVPTIEGSYQIFSSPGAYDRANPDVLCETETFLNAPAGPINDLTANGAAGTGSVIIEVGTYDGNCSVGSQDNILQSLPAALDFTVEESTISGSFSFGEGIPPLTFSGQSVS